VSTYIDTNKAFTAYLQRLRDRTVTEIAMDIEGEFNLHVYGERFCLLQLYDGQEEVVVDPVAVSPNLLKEFLEDRNLLKIIYDCSSDRLLLAKTHGILLNSILDLRPAVELLEFSRNDLGTVLGEAVGVEESGSKKRFQQYDWTRRPVDPAAIEYAVKDVRHLFALKDELLARLLQAGKMAAYILENVKRQDRPPELDRKPGIFRSGRHKRLSASQKREFQRLYDIRERHAQELDLPPNTVVANNDLFAIVTGEMNVDAVRGNRRMPGERLDVIKQEMQGAKNPQS
jgi:ribonuclease D